jgi:hypothetical protein
LPVKTEYDAPTELEIMIRTVFYKYAAPTGLAQGREENVGTKIPQPFQGCDKMGR